METEKYKSSLNPNFKNLVGLLKRTPSRIKLHTEKKTFNNIIVTKNANLTSRFVLAAHFDSKYFDPPNKFVGATDSAVPCAMLIDLAHQLDPYLSSKEYALTSTTTLQIIFFDGEEAFKTWSSTDSLYGSRHLAEKWEKTYLLTVDVPEIKSKTVIGGIETFVLLDLLGAKQPSFANYFQTTSWMFSKLSEIENNLHEKNIIKPEDEDSFDDMPYFDMSTIHTSQAHIEDDHLPFLLRGVPVLHIIAYPFPSVWHSIEDDLDAINPNTVFNLNTIFRIFTAEYLEIDPVTLKRHPHDELRRS